MKLLVERKFKGPKYFFKLMDEILIPAYKANEK